MIFLSVLLFFPLNVRSERGSWPVEAFHFGKFHFGVLWLCLFRGPELPFGPFGARDMLLGLVYLFIFFSPKNLSCDLPFLSLSGKHSH